MFHIPPVVVCDGPEHACREVAGDISRLVHDRSQSGMFTVLGLVGGASPAPLYQELVRLHKENQLSFESVIVFCADEFIGLPPGNPHRNGYHLKRALLEHVDLPPDQLHFPAVDGPEDHMAAHCAAYEARIAEAGGIDYQILGIGRTGHIGYNEPGSAANSRTQRAFLDPITRFDAAPTFGGIDKVPSAAITLGCGTILEARRIVLFAWGPKKAPIVQEAVEGPIGPDVTASLLRTHPSATIYLDHESASYLQPSMGGGGI